MGTKVKDINSGIHEIAELLDKKITKESVQDKKSDKSANGDSTSPTDPFQNLLNTFLMENNQRFETGERLTTQGDKDLEGYLHSRGFERIAPSTYAIINFEYQNFLLLPTQNNPQYRNIYLEGNFDFEIFPYIDHRRKFLNQRIMELNTTLDSDKQTIGLNVGMIASILLYLQSGQAENSENTLLYLLPSLAGGLLGYIWDVLSDRKSLQKITEFKKEYGLINSLYENNYQDKICTGREAIYKAISL
tara:strand:- start:48596 stop:49336 length:741 start_codon:yes stop_codon:yes gene_type:complete